MRDDAETCAFSPPLKKHEYSTHIFYLILLHESRFVQPQLMLHDWWHFFGMMNKIFVIELHVVPASAHDAGKANVAAVHPHHFVTRSDGDAVLSKHYLSHGKIKTLPSYRMPC
jgi:hypothetical protein